MVKDSRWSRGSAAGRANRVTGVQERAGLAAGCKPRHRPPCEAALIAGPGRAKMDPVSRARSGETGRTRYFVEK